jgi:hypothetical protein
MVMYLLFSTRFLLINFVEYIAERMTGDKDGCGAIVKRLCNRLFCGRPLLQGRADSGAGKREWETLSLHWWKRSHRLDLVSCRKLTTFCSHNDGTLTGKWTKVEEIVLQFNTKRNHQVLTLGEIFANCHSLLIFLFLLLLQEISRN